MKFKLSGCNLELDLNKGDKIAVIKPINKPKKAKWNKISPFG